MLDFDPFTFSVFSPLDIIFWGILGGIVLYLLRFWFYVWYDYKRGRNLQFVQIKIPKQDSKDEKDTIGDEYGMDKDFIKLSSAMTQLYESFYSVSSGKFKKTHILGQDYISLEYLVEEGMIKYVMGMPKSFVNSAIKQISAMYPVAVIDPIDTPHIVEDRKYYSGGHLHYDISYAFPLKTIDKMDAEPMNNIINALSKVEIEDKVGIQFIIKPERSNWQKSCLDKAKGIKKGGSGGFSFLKIPLYPFIWILHGMKFLFKGVDENAQDSPDTPEDLDSVTQESVQIIEEKTKRRGYNTVIRVLTASVHSQDKANEYWGDVVNSFMPFRGSVINGMDESTYFSKSFVKKHFENRYFSRPLFYWSWRFLLSGDYEWNQIFSSDELTAVYHFPNIKFNTSANIEWQGFKVTAPPNDMPKKGLLLGLNEYRGKVTEVRIKPSDRMRHFYLIGKSGTGKSTILEQMIRQDLANGDGLCLVDPHGDLVEAVLPYVPRERAEDVIVFDPADLDRPMGVNILEAKTVDEKEFMSQEALAIFIKLYGEEIMGPRLQNYFRNGVLTLMQDDEDPATLLDIMRLFTDDAYLKVKQEKVTNAAVKAFWEQEYAKSGDREKQEIIPYFAAKFGPFVTNSQIRNIIGQPKSGFNFREVMDEQKILLVNLSKGKLGDLNAKLLGMIFVSKIQMAAMSRVNIEESERKDFYLYVDEFQNFVTESFASILSEARKYRLGLIVAHQYISQITKMNVGGKGSQEDHTIKDAVFGNVGSMMNFKIGAQDAETMVKEFAPVFSETDLINIANYHAVIKLNINNTTSRGFVMKTIYDESGKDLEAAEAYKQLSRLKYARDKDFVEREIKRKLVGTTSNPAMDQAFKTPIF
jgi:hypothetical protein